MTKPRIPADLRERGRAFWRRVLAGYEPEPDEWALVHEIGRVLDEIDRLREQVDLDGPTSTGSTGQLVEHPSLVGLRAHRKTLGELLARLDLPAARAEADAEASPPGVTSMKAAKAAGHRWRGHNATKRGS